MPPASEPAGGAAKPELTVAAAVLRRDGKILICRRAPGGSCSLLWEFPGGKREPGETLRGCAAREVREELALSVRPEGLICRTDYTYPDRTVHLRFFEAEILGGTLRRSVHRELRWVLPEELGAYDFCPADRDVIGRLSGRAGEEAPPAGPRPEKRGRVPKP